VIATARGDKQLAQYPATIGDSHDSLPIGRWTITSVLHYPLVKLRPGSFVELQLETNQSHTPPGPNSPAGAAWIASRKNIMNPRDAGPGQSGTANRPVHPITNWDVDFLSPWCDGAHRSSGE